MGARWVPGREFSQDFLAAIPILFGGKSSDLKVYEFSREVADATKTLSRGSSLCGATLMMSCRLLTVYPDFFIAASELRFSADGNKIPPRFGVIGRVAQDVLADAVKSSQALNPSLGVPSSKSG